MHFDWDDGNIHHIALHNITPTEVEQVIHNSPFDGGASIRNGEKRTVNLGETDAGRILVVITTERDDKVRPVTARPARRNEREFFSQHKASADEQNSTDT